MRKFFTVLALSLKFRLLVGCRDRINPTCSPGPDEVYVQIKVDR